MTMSTPKKRKAGPPSVGYTQVPNCLIDDLLPHLTGAQAKVLLFLIRKIRGYHKQSDRISRSQICAGTGLNSGTVSRTVHDLTDRGLIAVEQPRGPAGRMSIPAYRVLVADGVAPAGDHVAFPAHGGNPHARRDSESGPRETPHESGHSTAYGFPAFGKANATKGTTNKRKQQHVVDDPVAPEDQTGAAVAFSQEERAEAEKLLRSVGLRAADTSKLIEEFGVERCARNVRGGQAKSKPLGPGGYRRAIEQDWFPEDRSAAEEVDGPECRRSVGDYLQQAGVDRIETGPPSEEAEAIKATSRQWLGVSPAWRSYVDSAADEAELQMRKAEFRTAQARYRANWEITRPPGAAAHAVTNEATVGQASVSGSDELRHPTEATHSGVPAIGETKKPWTQDRAGPARQP